jgi:nucleotide-binding universal stress UspA family protein
MYQRILLCTDGSAAADVATQYAAWMARPLNAAVRILYVTDIRLLEGPLMADIAGALGAQPYPALLPQLQEIQREKAATILAAAQQRCRDAATSCETVHKTGNLVQVMLEQERDADLVVLGQHGEHAQWAGGMLGSSVERMVRASIKPCLVTPARFAPVARILVAYDGSSGAGKALRTCLELAPALDAGVTIITVCQREEEESASGALKQAEDMAREKKLKPVAQLLHGDAETEILSAAEKFGADLIVMGAYGQTRIRELILGSTTSHILRKATVPVLLARG